MAQNLADEVIQASTDFDGRTKVLNERYSTETETRDYLDQLDALTAVPADRTAPN